MELHYLGDIKEDREYTVVQHVENYILIKQKKLKILNNRETH